MNLRLDFKIVFVVLFSAALLSSNVEAQITTFAAPVDQGQSAAGTSPNQGYVQPQQSYVQPQQPYVQPQYQWPQSPVVCSNRPILQTNQIGVIHDAYGRPIIHSQNQTVHESVLNPGAGIPVSQIRNVNRIEIINGVQVRVTGQEWMGADGQWHGRLNHRTITNAGGVPHVHDSITILGK